MATFDYWQHNRMAMALIRDWLIKTGALCGQKHPTKFIANWTEAKNDPAIIAWWRANRGISAPVDNYARRQARWQFQNFISFLSMHNPEEESLQHLLQAEFWGFVHDHRIAQKIEKMEAEERQKKMEEDQAIAKQHEAEILELRDKYLNMQRQATELHNHLKQRCKETHNLHIFFGM